MSRRSIAQYYSDKRSLKDSITICPLLRGCLSSEVSVALVFVLNEIFWGCDVLCNITPLLFGGCLCFTMQ